jgi:hemerythrin-like domain-containing protein
MEATNILIHEHRVIERVLNALQIAAERVSQGEEMRPAFFINAALFIKNFADGCHHRKEEGVLFVAMNESGMPTQGGPIGVMLAEHEQGRAFTREMKDAAEKWEAGDLSAKSAVVQNTLGYVTLLRQHIKKEDNILFPMANRVIPPERQEKVTKEFERIETEETGAGIHEKYLALAEVLEKESNRKI